MKRRTPAGDRPHDPLPVLESARGLRARVLAIVSLPPPPTGQAVASERLLSGMAHRFRFDVVNTSKTRLVQGIDSLGRILDVIEMGVKIRRRSRRSALVYHILSQSRAGNLRDLLVLRLLPRGVPVVVHLHGGALNRTVHERSRFIELLNRRAFRSHPVTGVVLGRSLLRQLGGLLPTSRIRVVENFAEERFFVTADAVSRKFASGALEIVYLSNMLPGKGYRELLTAAERLNTTDLRGSFGVTFIGRFGDSREEKRFVERVRRAQGVSYLGGLDGASRVAYLQRAHVLCLPTYYEYEGQPLAILEGYAAGCCVVTTNRAGIPDIFADGLNGWLVEQRSVDSLAETLDRVLRAPRKNLAIVAEHNTRQARRRFEEHRFVSDMESVFDDAMAYGGGEAQGAGVVAKGGTHQ